jgi:hypothetical protein
LTKNQIKRKKRIIRINFTYSLENNDFDYKIEKSVLFEEEEEEEEGSI